MIDEQNVDLTFLPQQAQLQNLSYGSNDLHARGSHFQERRNFGKYFWPNSVSRTVFIAAIMSTDSTIVMKTAEITLVFIVNTVVYHRRLMSVPVKSLPVTAADEAKENRKTKKNPII